MTDYIFMDVKLEDLKQQINSGKKAVFNRLITHNESYFDVELPSAHPASSTTFMGMAMANLSLAYVLTSNERYLLEAKRWIFACVNYPHWGNAHLVDVDLSAAWILFGMGISYDWLKDSLAEDEKKAVKDKLILQGTRMYDFKINTVGSGWSTNYWQNHNWINMTGLAAAGYAIVKEDDSVQKWIDSAKENFEVVFSVMPEDGSDYEGVVYWRYGAMWLYIYAHLLKEREGFDYFKSSGFLKNSFEYRLYQAAPNLEEQFNFGDAHDRRSGHSTAIYYKTAKEYKNGYAQKLGNLVRNEFLEREASLSKVKPGILPECFFEVLFYDESVEEKDFSDLPLTKYFDDLGLFVKKSSWEKDATMLSFKCSYPGGKKQWDLLWKFKNEKNYNCFGLSHQHPDNNSFLISTGGEFLAIDDGYNRTVKASDHNVILVDGVGYENEGQNNIWKDYTPDMIGEIENCIIKDSISYVVGETYKVYKKELKLNKCKRHIINTDNEFYIILDELSSDLEHIYTWQMYSDFFPISSDDCFKYNINGVETDLYNYSDRETSFVMEENVVRAVMTTQEPDKFTENRMKGLKITNNNKVKELSFLTAIVPSTNNTTNMTFKKIEVDGAYGIEVLIGDTKEVYLYSKDSKFNYAGEEYTEKLAILKIKDNNITKVLKI